MSQSQPLPSAPPGAARAAADTRPVRFRVFRWKKGDETPHFDEFTVGAGPATTVLDGLVAIRTTQDPSLTLRHSCFHASCGTCGMRVNEREVLACVTNVRELGTETVTVEPIANQNLVSDLATDMVDLYGRLDVVDRPLIRQSEIHPDSEVADGVAEHGRFEDCIECGLCLSACPIVASDPRYLGPAALAAAWRVVDEPRGRDGVAVLALTDDAQGSWRCHLAFECSEACPSNVDPAAAIMLLRRRSAGERLRTIFGRRDAR